MNKLIIEASESKIEYNKSLILGSLFIIFFSIIFLLIPVIILKNPGNISKYILNLLTFVSMILGVFIWIKVFEKRKFCSLGFEKKNWLKKYFKCMIIGIISISIVSIILLFLFNKNEYLKTFNFSFGIIMYCLFFIIQGAGEEILVRGFFMPTLGRKFGIISSIILSSLIFSALHFGNSGITIIAIVNLFLFGCVFGLMAYYYESLWFVCAFHSFWNFLQGNIFGINVSGNSVNIPLFRSKIEGIDYLTGGIFGAEGSILTTVMCIIFILFYTKLYLKKIDKKV